MKLYHGTSAKNARKIMEEGFKTDHKYNWSVKSRENMVYLSEAYAPFYAMYAADPDDDELALIKCEVKMKDCYPEDDFLMWILNKPVYTNEDLASVDIEKYKSLKFAMASLEYLGNVAARLGSIEILGVREFSGEDLILKCDPVITPMAFKVMGNYYKVLSQLIYEGTPVEKITIVPTPFMNMSDYPYANEIILKANPKKKRR